MSVVCPVTDIVCTHGCERFCRMDRQPGRPPRGDQTVLIASYERTLAHIGSELGVDPGNVELLLERIAALKDNGPDHEDGPEFEGWEKRSGERPSPQQLIGWLRNPAVFTKPKNAQRLRERAADMLQAFYVELKYAQAHRYHVLNQIEDVQSILEQHQCEVMGAAEALAAIREVLGEARDRTPEGLAVTAHEHHFEGPPDNPQQCECGAILVPAGWKVYLEPDARPPDLRSIAAEKGS